MEQNRLMRTKVHPNKRQLKGQREVCREKSIREREQTNTPSRGLEEHQQLNC
jgi:hypothetical protein